MKLALTFAAMLAVQAAPPQQFDLVCNGGMRFSLLDQPQAHSFRLHVDLDAGRWCQDSCKAVQPITEVQPGFIKFFAESEGEKARGVNRSALVSRETGKYLRYETDPARPTVIAIEAQCERAAFSGFPEIATKF